MLSSKKFWAPIGISILITVIAVLWVATMAFGGGTHSKPGPSLGQGALLFPYAQIVEAFTGNLGLLVITFLGQFPLYGLITGHANFRGNAKVALLALFITHILAYFVASYASSVH